MSLRVTHYLPSLLNKLQNLRPELRKHVPKLLRDFMARSWDDDADVRPPFEDIVRFLESCSDYIDMNQQVRACECRAAVNEPPVSKRTYQQRQPSLLTLCFHVPIGCDVILTAHRLAIVPAFSS